MSENFAGTPESAKTVGITPTGKLKWADIFGLIPDFPTPEPTFTLAQVEAHVEKLAGLFEKQLENHMGSGPLVEVTKVISTIRTTPIGEESA